MQAMNQTKRPPQHQRYSSQPAVEFVNDSSYQEHEPSFMMDHIEMKKAPPKKQSMVTNKFASTSQNYNYNIKNYNEEMLKQKRNNENMIMRQLMMMQNMQNAKVPAKKPMVNILARSTRTGNMTSMGMTGENFQNYDNFGPKVPTKTTRRSINLHQSNRTSINNT
jgi:hypothetical protein